MLTQIGAKKRRGKDAHMFFSLIYFFAPFSIFYIPHNYVIPQAVPHAIPRTHSCFYPHRNWSQSKAEKNVEWSIDQRTVPAFFLYIIYAERSDNLQFAYNKDDNTLGARDFSSAVSGFCQVFIAPLVASTFGQYRKFPPHARKTSGTQGKTTKTSFDKKAILLPVRNI